MSRRPYCCCAAALVRGQAHIHQLRWRRVSTTFPDYGSNKGPVAPQQVLCLIPGLSCLTFLVPFGGGRLRLRGGWVSRVVAGRCRRSAAIRPREGRYCSHHLAPKRPGCSWLSVSGSCCRVRLGRSSSV